MLTYVTTGHPRTADASVHSLQIIIRTGLNLLHHEFGFKGRKQVRAEQENSPETLRRELFLNVDNALQELCGWGVEVIFQGQVTDEENIWAMRPMMQAAKDWEGKFVKEQKEQKGKIVDQGSNGAKSARH